MAANSETTKFLGDLDGDIQFHQFWLNRWITLQWTLMILVAIAGAITAAAAAPETFGNPSEEKFWFQIPVVLFVSGLITTIGALINQFFDPRGKAEHHRKVGLAIWSIQGAVKYQNLSVNEAQQLRILAQTSPEEVLKRLSERPSLNIPNPAL